MAVHCSISEGAAVVPGNPEARLEQLVGAFRPVSHAAGTRLFKAGDIATHFELLTEGRGLPRGVADRRSSTSRRSRRSASSARSRASRAAPPRPRPRTSRSSPIPVGDLLGFFDANADIGLAFYKNLLGVVSDKVRRDRSPPRRHAREPHPHAEGDEADARDDPRGGGDARSRSRSSSRSISSSTTTAARTTASRRRPRIPAQVRLDDGQPRARRSRSARAT